MIIKNQNFEKYLKDESNFKSVNIERVYIPENVNEIINLVKEEKNFLNIYGGGTGVVGGVVNKGGSILSTEKLKNINIDLEKKIVEIEAGVLLSELHKELLKYDLWYPVDSTEQTATVGGNISTNASGPRSYKYGSIRNFVKEINIISFSGELLNIKRGKYKFRNIFIDTKINSKNIKFSIDDLSNYFDFKNNAGYFMKKDMDLIDLFIGSEGTLGIITGAKLKVLEKPFDILGILIGFDEENIAYEFVDYVRMQKKIDFLSIEFFDKNSLKFIADEYKINFKYALFLEIEIFKSSEEIYILENIEKLLKKYKISDDKIFVESTKNKQGFLYKLRESIPQKVNEVIRQKNLKKISTDFSVKNKFFYDMIRIYKDNLKNTKIKYVIFGHIGDNNLHINFLPRNEKEYTDAKKIYDMIAKSIIDIGGAISSEHGIGKIKKKYLLWMYNENTINKMKEIKRFFDPEKKFNIGNMFDI